MHFNQEFINFVEEKPIEGIVRICEFTLETLDQYSQHSEWTEREHELLWEAASLINIVLEANQFHVDVDFINEVGDIHENCPVLNTYISSIHQVFKREATKLRVESYTNRYKTALKSSFAYEFSQGDLERIQSLVNELRGHISENTALEAGHKSRLLKRLESLQSELHKRVSDLDRFWGMVGDAGVVLGKLGNDAKPIVDRVKEIAEIVWKTQARTEELPSNSPNPMLGHEKNT